MCAVAATSCELRNRRRLTQTCRKTDQECGSPTPPSGACVRVAIAFWSLWFDSVSRADVASGHWSLGQALAGPLMYYIQPAAERVGIEKKVGVTRNLVRRLERLGYTVTLSPQPTAA